MPHTLPLIRSLQILNRSLSHVCVYIFIGYNVKLSLTLLSEVIKLVEKSGQKKVPRLRLYVCVCLQCQLTCTDDIILHVSNT